MESPAKISRLPRGRIGGEYLHAMNEGEPMEWTELAAEALVMEWREADTLAKRLREEDAACFYFALVCSNDQLLAERTRRRRDREAEQSGMRISSTECFERLERQHLA